MSPLRWFLSAALSALAAYVSLQQATPVDRALPLIAVAVTLVAAVSYSQVMVAIPLLVIAEIALAGESLRLIAFGVIAAAAFGAAMLALPRRRDDPRGVGQALVLAAAAIFVLRWIPLDDVLIARELVLLAAALFVVVVLDGTPLAVAVAVVTALATSAVPLRTFWIPATVVAVAVAARTLGLPRLALTWPSSAVVAFALLFFPSSGIVARGLPYFLKASRVASLSHPIQGTLGPGMSESLEVPEGATSLVVSGANIAGLRVGEPLGRIEPGGVVIRVGDASDWGYMRREQSHGARNPLPRNPAGQVRGYGYGAWVDGAGRITLPPDAATIRVTAATTLPPGAALQVEGFESFVSTR